MALGARGAEVQRMFIVSGVTLAAIGLVVGLAAAVGVMRLLGSLLFGVSPFDPITYALVVVGLAAVAFVATWLPARQATRIDPMLALRAE